MISHTFRTDGVAAPRTKPEIDSLYVYDTSMKIPFTQKKQIAEYEYMMRGMKETAPEGEVYTYTQTVTIDGVKKGLTLVTKDGRKTYVKKFFKESIKQIKEDKLDKFRHAKARPSELGVRYFY